MYQKVVYRTHRQVLQLAVLFFRMHGVLFPKNVWYNLAQKQLSRKFPLKWSGGY